MSKGFVGRSLELEKLRSFTRNPSRSRLTALYGRWRVGKTRLVLEACGDFRLFRFEGLEGQGSAEQRAHFAKTLYRTTGLEAHRIASTNDWEDLLLLLAEHVGATPCVIFLDEFQWMASGRSDLVAKLKYVWDNHLKDKACVHCIVCGSVSSFIVKKVIRSKALFGRIDDIIRLRPLSFPEVRAGFFENRGTLEALEAYLLFGGIPTYLELLDPNVSVRLNIERLCFKPGAYFVEEFNRIFVSHFGSVGHYRRIVEELAARPHASREHLLKRLGSTSGGRISAFLDNLEMAGFIEGYGPVQNPTSSHLRRYRLSDPYLQFYFNFISPVRLKIERSETGLPLSLALPDGRFSIYLGLAFERFCYQHAPLIARKLGFSAVSYECGAYFGRSDSGSGSQIDLLFKRADRVITLCEVKFQKTVGRDVIPEVERKVQALSRDWPTHSIEKVLISAYPPSPEISNEGYFSAILTTADFALHPS